MTPPCEHRSIYFGSGGHYIFCDSCRAVWCANPAGDGMLTTETYSEAMSNVCQTGPSGPGRTTNDPR